jgi:hypothetical protein
MSKINIATSEVTTIDAFFPSNIEVNLEGTDSSEIYNSMVEKMLDNLKKFQSQGSNWVVDSIIEF